MLADHGGQPLAMLKYALHRQDVDFAGLQAIDAGGPDAMIEAFRRGQADYVHSTLDEAVLARTIQAYQRLG